MKKFIIKVLILFTLLFCCDRLAGYIFKSWLSNINTGFIGKDNYICDYSTEDILIFGSSRAEYHYNAKMMEDSLEITVYNCGTGGNGIVLSYGRLLMLSERYHPKLIILEIMPEYDLNNNKEFRDLGNLKRHYDRNGIKSIFEKIDSSEKYKMLSFLYRYNSDFSHNPLSLFRPSSFDKNAFGIQGYRARCFEFDKMLIKEKIENEEFQLDDIKLYYLKEFVKTAKEFSKVIFVISPYWQGRDPEVHKSAKQIADSLGVPFFDYSNDPKYYHKNEYYWDAIHLNNRGADEFTKDLIVDLRKQKIL